MLGQRFEGEGYFEISAVFFGEPVLLPHAVRKINTRHAHRRLHLGGGFRRGQRVRRREGRDLAHGIEQGQAEQRARAFEKRAAGEAPVALQDRGCLGHGFRGGSAHG